MATFNNRIYLIVLTVFTINIKAQGYDYPITRETDVLDVYFGETISDPYRWLEDQKSSEVLAWVDGQNKFTRKTLDKISGNFTLREQIRRNTYTEYFTPQKHGKYYFSIYKAYGGKQMGIYYTTDIKSGFWNELFINKDLNAKKDQVVSVSDFSISRNNKFIAYMYDVNGSDWKEIKVGDLDKEKSLDDHLYNVKYSSIVWRGNGFYYTRFDKTQDEYKQEFSNPRLYYHKIGTKQEVDSLVFKRNDAPYNMFSVMVTKDEKNLILEDNNMNTNVKSYYYFNYTDTTQKGFLPLIKKTGKDYSLLASKNDDLIFFEEFKDEKRVIQLNIKTPNKHLVKSTATKDLILRDVRYYNGHYFQICFYNQQEYILIINEKEEIIKKIELPFGDECNFNGFDYEKQELILEYGSILHPPVLAAIDLNKFSLSIVEPVKVSYSIGDFQVEKILYKSDTAMVPMLLLHNKKMKLDGNNPVLLEFYGGFGNINIPSYNPGVISFVENGGIYAYAMIRGGGEKGRYWHNDGRLYNRHKSINDIINASMFLSQNGYSKASKIAISGASHGGLMSAIAGLKRPDLFGAVVTKVGVLDMIRFEKFTIGSIHLDEYGTVNDSLGFMNIKYCSPLHNIKDNVKYPPFLIMTSEYDDRVPPLHSYKFTATLQNKAIKENLFLLRVEKNAGHNGSRTYEKYLDNETDFYSFILKALHVKGFD